ncbi:hypothetical protein PAXRUDRAFT_834033 [Paxillus rubicundulus Ve08.2h10]|uniref:Uncharacterized protein n=1 Tax=Paxillus rubicundulus Ve08.2h10 TaxID=930991 RepID=A0A0D0CVS8_9AGAM|nr:hypothetical protein PAXRUDRAFT_834033 [Paxillus rubicundulus Ve08.2h10]
MEDSHRYSSQVLRRTNEGHAKEGKTDNTKHHAQPPQLKHPRAPDMILFRKKVDLF